MGKFEPEDVDTSLCTHGLFAYADLDKDKWEIAPGDMFNDFGPADCPNNPGECVKDAYRRFTALASEDFVPMLSVGESASNSNVFKLRELLCIFVRILGLCSLQIYLIRSLSLAGRLPFLASFK